MKHVVSFMVSIFLMLSVVSMTTTTIKAESYSDKGAQAALNRINQIRQEAHREKIVTIWGNTDEYFDENEICNGSSLSWSSEAIDMAKIRAKEIKTLWDHTRPNGQSSTGMANGDSLENLYKASWECSMTDAVEYWYNEKTAYLEHLEYLRGNRTTDRAFGDWGHYNCMIMNDWNSVGLADYVDGWSHVVAVFTAKTSDQLASYPQVSPAKQEVKKEVKQEVKPEVKKEEPKVKDIPNARMANEQDLKNQSNQQTKQATNQAEPKKAEPKNEEVKKVDSNKQEENKPQEEKDTQTPEPTASSVKEIKEIDFRNVDFSKFEKVDDDLFDSLEGSMFEVEDVIFKTSDGTVLKEDTPFEKDQTYLVSFKLEAEDGYEFVSSDLIEVLFKNDEAYVDQEKVELKDLSTSSLDVNMELKNLGDVKHEEKKLNNDVLSIVGGLIVVALIIFGLKKKNDKKEN